MSAAGQRCVGWYHSHPVFEPRPSLKDMENQRNYQALTRDSQQQVRVCGGVCKLQQAAMKHAACSSWSHNETHAERIPFLVVICYMPSSLMHATDGTLSLHHAQALLVCHSGLAC